MQDLILSALFLNNVQNNLTPSRVTGVHSTNNERIRFLTVFGKCTTASCTPIYSEYPKFQLLLANTTQTSSY